MGSQSNHRLDSDIGETSESDRNEERRAALAQMMEENREGLGMKVIAVMVQRYGVLPKELWDLNSISDMGAGRGITFNDGRVYDDEGEEETVSTAIFESITSNHRYSIVNLTIGGNVAHRVDLPDTLRQLKIMAEVYDYDLDLPSNLQELTFEWECTYDRYLVLPAGLRKLTLGRSYSQPLTLPPLLVELELLGSAYDHPLVLPHNLKRLTFDDESPFNFLVALPQSLVCIQFGDAYDQPTLLPSRIEELMIGSEFTHDLSLPNSLRKIEWCCNRPIHIPEGVLEAKFGQEFACPVVLPASLKKVVFGSTDYPHPVKFPPGLQELDWWPEDHVDLVLPDRLRKLFWASNRNVRLPSGLKELHLGGDAGLVLPEGLLFVEFDCPNAGHYNVPASVQEVVLSKYMTFTHPATLHHLVLNFRDAEADLSQNNVYKLTIASSDVRIEQWPQGLEELEFTVDYVENLLRVPQGCRIVGEKRPSNLIME